MTPNKKAWELIDLYYPLVEFDLDRDKQIQNAKKVAIINVEQIIKARTVGKTGVVLDKEYWEEVRTELNAL